MKNILYFLALVLFLFISTSQAQPTNNDSLENKYKEKPLQEIRGRGKNYEEDLTGLYVYYQDYKQTVLINSLLDSKKVTMGQALTLLTYLIRKPSQFNLKSDRSNLILTSLGIISINYINKEWKMHFLSFAKTPRIYNTNIRVFTLKKITPIE